MNTKLRPTSLEEIMLNRQESIDPSQYQDEEFELFSIPAYDSQNPEISRGSEIGSAKKRVEPGDVLLSRIVPHIRRAWVVPESKGNRQIASGEWIVFRSKAFYSNYLRHYLMSDVFHAQFMNTVAGVGGSLLRARPAFVAEINIPLPPLPEQKRIADILDKADAIRRKRREATISIDRLLHSWFMSTVGPDAKDCSIWPIRSVEDLAIDRPGSMRTGPFGSDLKHSEFVNEGIAVLGIDNAVQNRFTWAERRFISEEKYIQLSRYRVFPGDVIITIMGTVGRSAVVPDDIPEAINTKHLACITANRKEVEPEFLSQAFFRHPEVLRQLGLAGRGAIMTGLNLGIIKNIRLPVPPISVQRQFTAGVAAIRKQEFKASLATASSDTLFNSLIDRCFRGDSA